MSFTSYELWDAVERTKEAISIIRKKKEADDRLQTAIDKKERLFQKVAAYEGIMKLSEDPREAKKIKKCSAKASRDLAELIKQVDTIEREVYNLNDEVESFMKFMDSFSKISYEDYKYLVDNCKKFEQKEWEPVVLLVVNHGINPEEREKIRKDLCELFTLGNFPMFSDTDKDLREEFINKWLISASYRYL